MISYLGHWAMLGYGYWAVADKTSDRLIGELGFADFKREIHPPITGTPELGWGLMTAHHGKGLATEALAAAMKWGKTHLPTKQTVCLINPTNAPSLRVAEKLGFTQTHTTTSVDQTILVFSKDL